MGNNLAHPEGFTEEEVAALSAIRGEYSPVHINDMDELFLPIPSLSENDLGYFVAIMQCPRGKEGESFAWYCEECWTILHEWRLKSGELGFLQFWKGERAAVDQYNGDVALRTCNECGHVNPMAYCWNAAKDTPEEKEARVSW